jgi:hypothetical protein
MELTLTNNFYRYMAMLMFGNDTALNTTATNTKLGTSCPTFQPLVDTGNNQRTTMLLEGSDGDKFNSFGAVSVAKTNAYPQLRFDIGSDGTEATKEDHALTPIEDTSYTVKTEIMRYVENNSPKVKYTVTVSAVSADITFSEIGMLKLQYGTNTGIKYDYLLGRVAIPETTITVGNSKVFDIEITIPS